MASSMFQGIQRKSITRSAKSSEHVAAAAKRTAEKVKEEPRGFFQRIKTFTDWHILKKESKKGDKHADDFHEGGSDEDGTPDAGLTPAAGESGSETSLDGMENASTQTTTTPRSPSRVRVFHFAPFSDDIAANARISTTYIPQYVPGHPHTLPNHFQHGIRLVTEMRRLSMVDKQYLQPKNLLRTRALPSKAVNVMKSEPSRAVKAVKSEAVKASKASKSIPQGGNK